MECQWKSNLLWNEWISELTLPLTVRYTTRKRKRACLSRREIGKRSDRHCTGNGCSGYEFSGPNLLTVHYCQLTKMEGNDPVIFSQVSWSRDILILFWGVSDDTPDLNRLVYLHWCRDWWTSSVNTDTLDQCSPYPIWWRTTCYCASPPKADKWYTS